MVLSEKPYRLPCNGLLLSAIFKPLLLNQVIVKDQKNVSQTSVNWKKWNTNDLSIDYDFLLEISNKKYEGKYECYIFEPGTDRIWKLNEINLIVIEKISLVRILKSSSFWIVLIFLLILFILSVTFGYSYNLYSFWK